MHAWVLSWPELAAHDRTIDPARIDELVRPVLERGRETPRDRLQSTLQRTLVAEYGLWVDGWTWAASEPGGGGPVRGWCCASHSILPDGDDPVGITVGNVVRAVSSWRDVLDELAALFERLMRETATDRIERAVERAAGELLPFVLERTGAEDAWYRTFARLATWYLQAAGFDREDIARAVEEVASGRFSSWIEPDADVARAALVELGGQVARLAEHEPEPIDAIDAWRRQRARGFGAAPGEPASEPVEGDGHARYLARFDRPRDAERAERLEAALMLCRDSARRGMKLTLDQLAEWQAIVLGHPVELRTRDAFGKAGRERYPYRAELHAELERVLAEAGNKDPIVVRAARVYLDVCFYHPFDDGNARAARLALDHVLTRAGYALHTAEPVFSISRRADDPHVAFSLAYTLSRLIGPAEAP